MVVHVDQKTKKQNGVVCDICGSTYIDKFSYYSCQFDKVDVDVKLGKVQLAGRDLVGIQDVNFKYLSLDICNMCMNDLISKIKNQIAKRDKPGGGAWTTKT